MNAEEIINGVTDLDDRNVFLKREVERLEVKVEELTALAEVGIEKIVDDATRYVPVEVRRDDGDKQIETFESWKKRLHINVPASISANALERYIAHPIRQRYEESRAEQVIKFQENETKAAEAAAKQASTEAKS